MSTRKLFLTLIGAAALLVGAAFGQTQNSEATVLKVTGNATLTVGGATSPLQAGAKVPVGATITTGANAEVFLESHAGYVTSIKSDSVVSVDELSVTRENGQVKEEKTLLDLKSGSLVAKLDPKKKTVNNYQVRTAKGVAAARGTVFSVQYRGGTYMIAVINGQVTVTPPQTLVGGSRAVQVGAGEGAYVSRTGSLNTGTFDTLIRSGTGNGATLRELLAVAVATVTLAAQNNIGGATAAEAAEVARAVFSAAPEVVTQAAAIIRRSGGDTSNEDPVMQAVRNEVPASMQGAFDASATSATFEQIRTGARGSETTSPQPIDPSVISRSN